MDVEVEGLKKYSEEDIMKLSYAMGKLSTLANMNAGFRKLLEDNGLGEMLSNWESLEVPKQD